MEARRSDASSSGGCLTGAPWGRLDCCGFDHEHLRSLHLAPAQDGRIAFHSRARQSAAYIVGRVGVDDAALPLS
jgi:hypothetical protein